MRCFIAARREDLMGLGPLGSGQPSGELEMVGGIMVWSQLIPLKRPRGHGPPEEKALTGMGILHF